MGLEIVEPNTCIRGRCSSNSIPLHLPPSSYALLSPIARGAESVVYEGILDGRKVAVKKPILSTSDDIDKFHKELQLLCAVLSKASEAPGEARRPSVASTGTPGSAWRKRRLRQERREATQARGDASSQQRHSTSRDPFLLNLKKTLFSSTAQPLLHDGNSELLTGVVPYTDLRAEAQAYTVLEMNYTEQQLTAAVVSCKLRPVLAGPESGASTSMLTLIQRCWDENPQNRPSFSDIILEICPILEHRKKSMEENFAPGASSILEVEQFIDGANNLQTFLESVNWSTQGKQLSKKASLAVNSHMNNWLDSLNEPLAYHPVLSLGSFATCGRRETMEDAHFLMPHMCNEKDIHVFGFFDGHRGAAAAEFSVQALPGFLQSLASIRSPIDALFEAFVSTDAAFRNELDSHRKFKGVLQKDWHPGCAAVAALIVRNKLFVANAGDCRTILCRAGHAFPLSKDHVASCLEERERVISAGGQVKWQVDTWRVGPAALQVTRSIGDDDLKPAVTAEPEITETTLSAEDEFLVVET
ncbi:protein kinase and PP2C-like domain-containing protein isoform X2 [Hevea brasiliensis]|uniref:protein kinase and PP2C-like domain-containing protein isoform X2 n=1 Tax=Hevea brasiliensis TaxID=3981 RepID=UPI00260000BB|nr:protein kinase and PP2C-like domain-containing protein isoform X2 [Hevea brasiliensis]